MKPKKERTESKRNKAKVIKAITRNPLATTREIAKETGISKSTVATKLDEIGH